MRESQRAATRARILRAVSDLVAEEHPATISVPAVARRAAVGVATVYRYFPTKEALLDAAATEAVSTPPRALPQSLDDLGPSLVGVWQELAKQMPLVRNQFASPAGRELIQRRWEAKHATITRTLVDAGLDPTSEEGQRLIATADVLTSSTALLELHDKAGVDPTRAAEWCAWAVQVLYEETLR